MQNCSISVIIVVFNSQRYIKKCLNSLLNQKTPMDEIIIIDNNSTDNTADLCKRNDLPVKYIKENTNTGFCHANNKGISLAKGEWILCLNSDVTLDENFIENIKNTLKTLPDNVGGINPKVYNKDKKTIYANGIYLDRMRRFKCYTKVYKKQTPVWGVNAAACVYRKSMLESIKYKDEYFDNLFFFLAEDIDISFRANNLGWKFLHLPQAECIHIGNCSSHPDAFRTFLSFRNRYYLILKNEQFKNLFKDFIFILPYDVLRNVYLLLSNKYWIRAVLDIVRNYKNIKNKRNSLIKQKGLNK